MSEEEIWTETSDFPGYKVSTKGRIMGKRGREIAQTELNGYKKVSLYNSDGSKKLVFVHRLVCQAFLPNPNNLVEVDHKDRDRANNTIDNLIWSSKKDNAKNKGPMKKRKVFFETDFFPEEEWRPIPGDYKFDYQASSLGRIKGKFGRITRGAHGIYRKFNLFLKDGTTKSKLVHNIIADIFLKKPDLDNLIVNHKDLCKHNNRVDNLEWTTRSGNSIHAVRNGAIKTKPVMQLSKDGKIIKIFDSMIEAAKALGVTLCCISEAVKGGQKTCKGFLWKRA